MGQYDISAFVDKVLEVTGKPKVTMMAYSQGGAQVFYALAKNQDWYASRVHRFVSLSACHYYRMNYSYEHVRLSYIKLYELGVYNFFGDDESSMTLENCAYGDPRHCDRINKDLYG